MSSDVEKGDASAYIESRGTLSVYIIRESSQGTD
jgi:hypothetical protein